MPQTELEKKEFIRSYRFMTQETTFKPIVGDPDGSGGVEVATVVRRVEREGMTALRVTIDESALTIYMAAHDAVNLADALKRSAAKIDPDYRG